MMGKLIKKSESWIVSSFDGGEYPVNPYHNYRFNKDDLNVLDLFDKEIQFRVEFMWGTGMEKIMQVAIIDEI